MPGRTLLAALAALATVAACGRGDRPHAANGATASKPGTALTGAGATFPNPIYTKWFDAYARSTGVRINYQSIGSGGGIRQFTEGTVDFGASDGPMTDAQVAAVQGNVVHIPTVLGAVVLTYNVPELGTTALKFDGPTVADIWTTRRLKLVCAAPKSAISAAAA